MDQYSEDELREDGDNDFVGRATALRVCWTDWCSRLAVRRLGKASIISMMRVGAWYGQLALFLVTPFISLVGLAFVARMVALN
jgi:hypothetical protein